MKSIRVVNIQLLEYVFPTAAAAAPSSKNRATHLQIKTLFRLTHHPGAHTLEVPCRRESRSHVAPQADHESSEERADINEQKSL